MTSELRPGWVLVPFVEVINKVAKDRVAYHHNSRRNDRQDQRKNLKTWIRFVRRNWLDQQKIKYLYGSLVIVKNKISLRFTIPWEYHISGKLDLSYSCFLNEIEQGWLLRFFACANDELTSWPFIVSQKSALYGILWKHINNIANFDNSCLVEGILHRCIENCEEHRVHYSYTKCKNQFE
jgi:nuclear transport factor 2 (NTF2) superfamily protein